MNPWGVALAVIAAGADVAGAYIVVGASRGWDRRLLRYCVAVGAGFMLAAAFVRMLPESLETLPSAFFLVLVGYFGIHLFEHTVAPHFHFGEEVHPEALLRPSVGYLAVLGLGVHTFFDGVAIMSGFVIGPSLGVVLFVAVLLHKLPEGFTVASVMLAAGRSRTAALMAAVVLGGLTIGGAFATALMTRYVQHALAVSAGVTIYVAASDLIPEVNREGGPVAAIAVFAGLILFLITELVIDGIGLH